MPDFIQPDHLEAIKAFAADHPSAYVRRRADILLLSEAGRPVAEIVQTTGLSASSVHRWRRLYREQGMGIFPAEAKNASNPAAKETPEVAVPEEKAKKDKKKGKAKKDGKKKDKKKGKAKKSAKKGKAKKDGKKKDKKKGKAKKDGKKKGKKGGKKAKPKT